jgi:signal transduction histidine kinase
VKELGADGLRVTLAAESPTRALPPGIDLSVYRVVQEALTNVRRHAGRSASAVVRLTAERSMFVVEVTDDGVATSGDALGPNRGHGLVGMQERALFFGGSFEAGPRVDGGFRVMATFPLPVAP